MTLTGEGGVLESPREGVDLTRDSSALEVRAGWAGHTARSGCRSGLNWAFFLLSSSFLT